MKFYRQILFNLFLIINLFFGTFPSKATPTEIPIKKVDSLDPVIAELAKAGQETLVVFDVDYVLLVPKDLIARPASREVRHTLFPDFEQKVGKDKFLYLSSILRLQGGVELVDPRFPELLKNLQDRSVKVIALTAQGYGSFGAIPDEGSLRIEELKKLGLDFGNSFPFFQPFLLDISRPKHDLPLYREGVIFTDRSSKGDALIAFLKHVQWIPKQIIVVDDGRGHLEHIQEALQANHINGLLFLYIDGELATEHSDPALAQAQFDYLIKNEKWLSDEDARKRGLKSPTTPQ